MHRVRDVGTRVAARASSMPSVAAGTIICVTMLLAGCKLPGWSGPVSGEVLTCRQHTQRALSAIDRGQWEQAETSLRQAVQACPADCEARRHYAETLWRRGARAEAVAQLQEAVKLAGDDPSLVVRLGEMLLADNRTNSALACAQQALDVDPRLARAWMLRAEAMQRSGQPRQALADYHRALSSDRGNREALLRIAELHRELNQPQRALVALQSLADTYPLGEEPQHVSYLTGLAYSALSRHDDAVDSYRRAARHEATPEILYRLAEAEMLAGRPAQAHEAVVQALVLDPQHEPSRVLQERLVALSSDDRLQR